MTKVRNLHLRDFLKPWLQFRAFVKFKDGNKRHIFGREWPNITIEQIIWGHVPELQLDRLAGYADLIAAIETGFIAGKFTHATIYQRDHTGKFNRFCREYVGGKIVPGTVADPEMDTSDLFLILYPAVDNRNKSINFLSANQLKEEFNKNFNNENTNNKTKLPPGSTKFN